MYTIERLNHVINYIEDHLSEEIDYQKLANIFQSSLSVLQKTFIGICDITLSEYIRKRRLSEAVFDLRSDMTILDIAIKYQYRSADAFSRAFKLQHGINPSAARGDNVDITSYSKIVFTLTIEGVIAMNYQLEAKPAIRIVGYQ